MRLFTFILAGLLALIQYPLWLGKGGWLRTWELDRQLDAQRAANAQLRARNAALEGEVNDLQQGQQAVEERARYELGMIRSDELFVQWADRAPGASPASSASGARLPSPVAAGPQAPTSSMR